MNYPVLSKCVIEEKEWKSFRNSLDKSDRKIVHLSNSASSYAAKPIRIQPTFMSIIFHHYKQLAKLSKEIRTSKGTTGLLSRYNEYKSVKGYQ